MTRRFLFHLTLMLGATSVYAAPPNDNCSQAVTLTVDGPCENGDNTGATTEGMSVPNCWSGNTYNYSHSVWYNFVATDDSISVNIGDGIQGTTWLGTKTLTAVYSGACGSFTEIACGKNGNETKLTSLTVGNTYYIMIDGFANNTGTFCIRVYESPTPPPAIGTCSNPRNLFVGNDCMNVSNGTYFDNQDNMLWTNSNNGIDDGILATGYGNPLAVDGTTQGSMCSDNDAIQDAYWVQFTATDATQVFNNMGSGTLDYAIFTGTCSALSFFDCYSIPGTNSTTIGAGAEPDLTSGTSYLVMITNAPGNSSPRRYLCITSPTVDPCEYDDCSSAFPISSNVAYTLDNANCSADLSLCAGTTENNIWLSWTCPSNWSGSAYVHLYNEDCAGLHGMQLSIYAAGIGCVNNNSNCVVTLNPNNNNDFFGNFSPTPGSTYLIDLDGYAGCGCQFDFMIDGTIETILPIELLSFNADIKGGNVNLNWVTASEKDNDYFSVERSSDGENFESIKRVEGAGTSTAAVSYSAVDENPLAGTSYYRLRQTNFNGSFQYSKSVNIYVAVVSSALTVYPNPALAENQIHLAFIYPEDEKEISFEVRNALGRLQLKKFNSVSAGANDIVIPAENLEPGLYNILINGSRQQLNSLLAIAQSK